MFPSWKDHVTSMNQLDVSVMVQRCRFSKLDVFFSVYVLSPICPRLNLPYTHIYTPCQHKRLHSKNSTGLLLFGKWWSTYVKMWFLKLDGSYMEVSKKWKMAVPQIKIKHIYSIEPRFFGIPNFKLPFKDKRFVVPEGLRPSPSSLNTERLALWRPLVRVQRRPSRPDQGIPIWLWVITLVPWWRLK